MKKPEIEFNQYFLASNETIYFSGFGIELN